MPLVDPIVPPPPQPGPPGKVEGRSNVEGVAGVMGFSESCEGVHGETRSTSFAAVAGISLNPASPVTAVYGEHKGNGPAVFGVSHGGEGVHGETKSLGVAGVAGFSLNPGGTGAAVYGESRNQGPGIMGISKGSGGAGLFVGNVTVTGDIILSGADCAEHFDVVDANTLEPGTVMVINNKGILEQSSQAYDKKAAGVISGAGDHRTGIVLDKQASEENRKPIALIGKVNCKVDARYSPIEVGDMLSTSPTPGHAMKAGDPTKAFGAVIGKALGSLSNGTGLVPILVCLQ